MIGVRALPAAHIAGQHRAVPCIFLALFTSAEEASVTFADGSKCVVCAEIPVQSAGGPSLQDGQGAQFPYFASYMKA